jgi:hypothetical protein
VCGDVNRRIDRAHEAALAQPDPREGLRMAANIQRRQFEQMYDVIAIYQEAARTDPDIPRVTQTIAANRERAFRRHIATITAQLTPGMSADDGVSIYLALVLPRSTEPSSSNAVGPPTATRTGSPTP